MGTSERRVFVVDDEERVLRALRRLIAASGFRVETFRSAAELLNAPMATARDVLLVDVDMPGMSGPELRDILRARGCESALIFITAHDRDELGQDVGPEPVLFKPIDADVMMRAIDGASSRSQG